MPINCSSPTTFFCSSFFSFYRIPGRLPGSFIFLLLTRARMTFIFLLGHPFFQSISLTVHFLKIFLSVVDLSPLFFFFLCQSRIFSETHLPLKFHRDPRAKLVPLLDSIFSLNSAVGAWLTTKADKRWVTGKCLFSCVLILLNFR